MSFRQISVLSFVLLAAASAGAQTRGTVAVRILDEPIVDLRAYSEQVVSTTHATAPSQALAGRSTATSDVLLVPYYESNRKDPNGVNTLFAVRNETDREVPVRILYVDALGATEQAVQEISLPPNALRTINVRDVPDLPTGADGVARGLVILGVIGHDGESSDLLSGDFFFVDPSTDFATGNSMLNMSLDDSGNEFCAEWGSRFFHGGSFQGTSTFRFVVDEPGGSSEIDPPTAVGTVYDEGGVPLSSFEIFTDLNSFELSSDQVVPEGATFGSISVRFPATKGAVLVEHTGFHRLSVAFKAACRDSVEAE